MLRFLKNTFIILAMLGIMVLAAAVTLRIALHGREVSIPDFAGMTAAEASEAALHDGLDLTIENKFYSTTVPAGRMLSQAPAPGSKVRRGWQVRVTESLGPQQVTIPDVAGQPLREATMSLRRMSLDLGTVAHFEAPGDADIVLAQTPPPDAGVDQPRVSLLLSSAASGASNAIVMPSLIGMSYASASHTASALGLRIYYISDTPAPTPTPDASTTTPSSSTSSGTVQYDANGAVIPQSPVVPTTPGGPVTAQKPEAGNRVSRGESVRITFGHTASATPTTSSTTSSTTSAPQVVTQPAH